MGRRTTYETSLVGLIPPPGNEAALTRAQERCFQAYGHPSSRALPPVVPLVWLDQDPPAPAVHQVRTPVSRAPAATGLALHGDTLFLSLECERPWASLRSVLGDLFAGLPGAGLFPMVCGFFLCNGVQKIAAAGSDILSEPIRFHRLDLAAFSIVCADPPDWWTQVQWELLWRVRCISDRAAKADS